MTGGWVFRAARHGSGALSILTPITFPPPPTKKTVSWPYDISDRYNGQGLLSDVKRPRNPEPQNQARKALGRNAAPPTTGSSLAAAPERDHGAELVAPSTDKRKRFLPSPSLSRRSCRGFSVSVRRQGVCPGTPCLTWAVIRQSEAQAPRSQAPDTHCRFLVPVMGLATRNLL